MSMNPIELAVLPLKQDAVIRAEQDAIRIIKSVEEELLAANNDLNICAPYPLSSLYSSNNSQQMKSKYLLFRMLVKSREACLRPGEPNYGDLNEKLVDKFINNAKESASEQYDMFVAKLMKKIGVVKDATLTGNHVWSFSVLTVTLLDDTKQNWKTQQITNVSKLGKLFNQWPSRLIKQ